VLANDRQSVSIPAGCATNGQLVLSNRKLMAVGKDEPAISVSAYAYRGMSSTQSTRLNLNLSF
jgi:hypothetical protein